MGTKITALPPILTVENTDVLPIVDITDTTTKKITIAQIETKLSASFLSSGDNISLLTNDSGYITVSDFSNNGENAGVNRDLGNLDAFALSFITSGLGRINIEAGGNVGIGTSTPTEKLEVVGNTFVNTGKLTVSNAFNTSTGAIEATAQATSGSSGFTSAGKFNSLITTAGFSANNVGVLATAVGGTSETFAAKFQVNSGAVDTPSFGTYGVFSRNNATTTTPNYAGYFKSENDNGSSNHAIYGFADGTGTKNIAGLFNSTGATNNYAIIVPSGGGNVGIGTTTPDANAKLDVNGVIKTKSYVVASLPTIVVGGIIYVSDETGGAVLAFSDGVDWRRVTDRAIVS